MDARSNAKAATQPIMATTLSRLPTKPLPDLKISYVIRMMAALNIYLKNFKK